MLKDNLHGLIKGGVKDDLETLQKYSRDASIFEIIPKLVITPEDTEDLKNIVRFVNGQSKDKLSITCRSAGTDMTGGAINDSIILDMQHFNKIQKVGEDYAIIQPGVMYKDFDAKTKQANLFMPIYPASRDICSVGGMVATNAGGELDLTYGEISNYLLELKVILADGKEYICKPLNITELNKKMSQEDFEGEVYRDIYDLVIKNQELIKTSRPKISKNSTGYLIWDVWDGEIFDLTKLFIGSQGTLGIITEIKFKLIKPKTEHVLLVVNLPTLEKLDQVINKVLAFKPESFECFDKQTLELATKFSSDLLRDFKHNNRLMAFVRFLPEKLMQLTNSMPELVMLANFTGHSKADALLQAQNAQEELKKYQIKSTIYASSASAEKFWIIRHKSFGLLRSHSQNGQASPFIDDIIVKPEYLPEFLPKLNSLIRPYKNKMVYTLAGHIGDGNFHIIPLMDLSDPEVRNIIPELMEKVFDLVFEYKGSMSAEHNDGLIRGPYLKKMYGEEMLNIFKSVKQIFDPKNIFNPHKKTDSSMSYSFDHILKPKPIVES